MDKIRLVWKGSLPLDESILTLPDTWMSNTHKQRVIKFELVCNNSTLCKDTIVDVLKESPGLLAGLELEYVISAKRTSTKTVTISGNSFMSSNLFAEMKAMPGATGSMRYLTSSDANLVADEVASNIVASVVRDYDYEASVDSVSVTDLVLDLLTQQKVSTERFNDAKWNSVYWDPIFLRPDKVTSALNDHYVKKTVDTYNTDTEDISFGLTIDPTFFGITNGTFNLRTESKEELVDKLSELCENKTHVEWTGEKFELHAMDLFRVNLAQFDSSSSVAFTDVKIYPYVPYHIPTTTSITITFRILFFIFYGIP